jgi:hypothetical protein
MAQLNFNASTVKPIEAMEAIPPGWYTAQMSASEMKPTSGGDGEFLNCEFAILAPQEFAARKVFTRLNLQNKNPVAVEIAYRTLSAICHAVGVIQVDDSAQLHNRPMQIKVKLRPAGIGADNQHHEASNEINGYKAVEAIGATPMSMPPASPVAPGGWQPPATPATPAPTPAAAPAATPPWAAAPAPAAPVEANPDPAPAAPVAPAAVPPWQK